MKYTYYAYISLQFRFSLIECMRYFTIYDKSCKCILNKPHNLAEYFFKIFFSGIDIFTTTKMWPVYAKMGRVVGMSKVHTGRSIFQSKEIWRLKENNYPSSYKAKNLKTVYCAKKRKTNQWDLNASTSLLGIKSVILWQKTQKYDINGNWFIIFQNDNDLAYYWAPILLRPLTETRWLDLILLRNAPNREKNLFRSINKNCSSVNKPYLGIKNNCN